MSFLIVDGMSILHNVAGPNTMLDRGYTFSFFSQLTATIRKHKGIQGVFVCWEGGPTRRKDISPDYKSNRKPIGELVYNEQACVQKLLKLVGAHQFTAPGYEADDVGASLVNLFPDVEMILYSNDKDWLQLVRPNVSLFQKPRAQAWKKDRRLITMKNFEEMVGWRDPKTYLLGMLAIGDAVDGIKGIAGIGPNPIHAYLHGGEVPQKKAELLDTFYADSPQMLLNKELIDLTEVRDLPMVITPGKPDRVACNAYLEELAFASVLRKFPEWFTTYEEAYLSADIFTV